MRMMTYSPAWYIQQFQQSAMCTTVTNTAGANNTFTPQHFMLCIFIAVVIVGAVTLIIDYQISREQQRIEEENKDNKCEIIWK